MVANSFAFSIFECKFNEMKTERLFLVLSALCICVARGQTANEADGTDCNGKLFRCVDPGSYIRCDVDPADSNHTSVGASDTVICADDTICDDNAELPCSPNETAPEETPSEPETEPEQVPTETPSEPSNGNSPDDGGEDGEVNTPSGEDGETESTSENSDPNEGETTTPDSSNGDNGSGESTEPSDSNGAETSTPSDNEPESTTASDEANSPTLPNEPTPTPETPEFTCPAVGRFPHPTDCQKYNFCWDLEHPYVTFTCKAKHVYDARLGRCANDWSACPNAPQCVANHQVLADAADNRFYFVCKNIGSLLWPQFVIHKKECDKHSTFDPDLLVCVLNEIEGGVGSDSSESDEHHEKVKFECTEAGIFADLTDETKYYECIVKNVAKGKLKTHHRSCPKHQVFSLQVLQCIPVLVGEVLDEQ